MLLKPLAYPEPERLVQVWEKPPGGQRNGISALNFLDWQKQNTSFTAMAASTGKTATLSGWVSRVSCASARSVPHTSTSWGFGPLWDARSRLERKRWARIMCWCSAAASGSPSSAATPA